MTNYLSTLNLNAVRFWLPRYQWAINRVGLSYLNPLVLGGIHFEESEFGDHGDPHSGEGPFGCDQGGNGQQAIDNVRAYAEKVAKLYGYIPPDPDQPNAYILDLAPNVAVLACAHEFKTKLNDQLAGDEKIADGYWGYNGRSGHHNEFEQTGSGSPDKTWRWSPYVVNDPASGLCLVGIGSIPDTTVEGGRRVIRTVSKRPGALIVYRELLAKMA